MKQSEEKSLPPAQADPINSNSNQPEVFNEQGIKACREKKYDEAIRYFEKAIALDFSNAINNRAIMYHCGLGTSTGKPDYKKAAEYYGKAIGCGHAGAMDTLGGMYRDGLVGAGFFGIPDDTTALSFFKMAVAKNHVGAMYNLANLYETRLKDIPKAIQYYQEAITKGQ